jgi:hypothetical protein
LFLVDDLELVAFQDAGDLVAGMHGPWTGVVQLEVDLLVL